MSPNSQNQTGTLGHSTLAQEGAPVTLWIAVPEGQHRQATHALVDADVTVQGTWTGPTPGSPTTPQRDPGGTFLFISLGLILLGLGIWTAWHGGWWIILTVVAVLSGLVCITAALARPKPPTGQVSEPA